MIAVRLMGGLGNQLFQYAFGRQCAQRLGVPLQFDLRWFDSFAQGTTPRVYELGRYPIRATVADAATLPRVSSAWYSGIIASVWNRISHQLRIYDYQQPGYNSDTAKPRDNTLYIGYWQSERYFSDLATEIRSELEPNSPIEGTNAEYAAAIRDCVAVSLHVRRGDYVSSAHTNAIHGLAPIDYYKAAVARVRESLPEARFFVFSDDLAWCRDKLPLHADAVFVQGNDGPRAYEDLRLMSLCKHHVIANSSFSWWGAWLNPNPQKLVIAPRRWFADSSIDTTDMIPASWTQL